MAHICCLTVNLRDGLFTYLKSKFIIITDHMARSVTVIGCMTRSHQRGYNVLLIRVPLPSLYTVTISSQEKGLLAAIHSLTLLIDLMNFRIETWAVFPRGTCCSSNSSYLVDGLGLILSGWDPFCSRFLQYSQTEPFMNFKI